MTVNLRQSVEAALRDLASVWDEDGRVILAVPVRYPSGATAALEVSGGTSEVWISDRGFGLLEAEMIGAEGSFATAAKVEAARHGIDFDGHSIFAARVPIDQIAVGIVAVANASSAAATEAIRAASVRKAQDLNEAIFDRLQRIFPDQHISRKVNIAGDKVEWEAHNVVMLGDRRAIFEPVLPSAGSISAKFLMFSDLAKRPNLRLNAVVEDAAKLGNKGLMLRDVAKVIESSAPVQLYRDAA